METVYRIGSLIVGARRSHVIFVFLLLMGLMISVPLFVSKAEAFSGSNVAENKQATASCSTAPYLPERAVDGSVSRTDRWYCATGLSDSPKWLQVDLGITYSINGYTVIGMGSLQDGGDVDRNPRDFRLQKSSDGTTWADVDTVKDNSASVFDHNVPAFTSRYVRLYVDKGNQLNNTWTSVMEFRVYGNPLSSNAELSGLALSEGTLSPPYTAGMTSYTASVGNAITMLDVTPTTADGTATIKVNNAAATSGSPVNVPLSVGPNPITILVTDQDGTTQKTYTITVTRAASSNANLKNLSISPGTLTPVFAPGQTSYSATVSQHVYSIQVTAEKDDTHATLAVTANGNSVTGATYLNLGANKMEVIVTAPDNASTKTYYINVIKQGADNGADINSITLNNQPLQRIAEDFELEVGYETKAASLNIGLSDPNASFAVETGMTYTTNGNSISLPNLTPGQTTLNIIVTAKDGRQKTFKIKINRNARLSMDYLDRNKDGFISIDDVIYFAAHLSDINDDGKTDIADLRFMLSHIQPYKIK